MRHTYQVTAEPVGKGYWHIAVPEVDRVTQGRNAREVEDMARDLIAIMTGSQPDTFDIVIDWELPAGAQEHLRKAAELRHQAVEANAASAQEAKQGAKALHDAGLSVRDIGEVLGLSHQRAHQLIS